MCNASGPPLKKRKPQPLPPAEPFPIYLDHNATTPLCEEAWHAITRVHKAWGNPSSTHPYGLAAKYELESARAKVQEALHAPTAESIVFTSGGTESNNLAIIGGTLALRQRHPSRRFVVSTNAEHPAVTEVLKFMDGTGAASSSSSSQARPSPIETIRVAVNARTGQLDPETLRSTLLRIPEGPQAVAIVSVMFANNEIGSVNDIAELCRVTKEVCGGDCLFHSDAAQSLGKVVVDVAHTNVDFLSVCGHKFYAPKGVGALYVKPGVQVKNILFGAGHERGLRPGTENVLLAAGMAEALLYACSNIEKFAAVMRTTRDELLRVLKAELAAHNMDLVVNGDMSVALPNTLNCAIFKKVPNHKTKEAVTYISAQRLILAVGDAVCLSAGSACHSTAGEGEEIVVSDPLKAVGVGVDRAIGTLRISTGRTTTMDEVRRAAKIIARRAAQQFAE